MAYKKNHSLKAYNTFGLDVSAAVFCEVHTVEELRSAFSGIKDNGHFMILGGGSNVLFTKDYEGLVIKNSIQGVEVIDENSEHVSIKVGAGEAWHDFVLYAIDHNWGGIENLSLIPGTVGAAPMQNIGAYGVEIKEVFESLTALNIKSQELEVFDNQACEFGYRESVFKHKVRGEYVIVDVTFRLTKTKHQLNTSYGAIKETLIAKGVTSPTIRDISDAVIEIRKSKLPDPKEIGNSGSFFKNPTILTSTYNELKLAYVNIPGYSQPNKLTKVPAGWLIEQCGWKGFTDGEIGVHKKQALVLVNYGNGDGSSVRALSEKIQASVKEKFGIELQAEVNII